MGAIVQVKNYKCVPSLRAGNSEALVCILQYMVVRTFPRLREALYGGVSWRFKGSAHVR